MNRITFSRFCLILIIDLCLFSSPVYAKKKFNSEDFRNYVNREMKTWNVPGAAVCVIEDGKVIFSEGFGYRDVEKKLMVTPKTVFAIGSASKAFTSLTVGMLVDEKRLDWDRPIREYYPRLRMYDPYVTEHVTLRDALSHRSGVPRHDVVWPYEKMTRKEIVDRIRYLQPSYGFREVLQYNNFLYVLSGAVAGEVAGKSWEEFVKERIFTPLGMASSNFDVEESQRTPDFALPYGLKIKTPGEMPEKPTDVPVERVPFHQIQAMGPTGSINSNLEDMTKWVMLHLNEGKAGEKQIVSKEALREMHTPQMAIKENSPLKILMFKEMPIMNYGLGWFIQPYRGNYLVHHGGNIDGFSSFVSFMPEEKIGIVVLTNMNATWLPHVLTYNIYDRLLGFKEIDWSKKFMDRVSEEAKKKKEAAEKEEKERKKDTCPTHPFETYTGQYANPAYGLVIIGKEGDHLNITYKSKTGRLIHYHYDTFKAGIQYTVFTLDHKVTFQMNEKGDIDRLSIPLEGGVSDIIFKKTP
mgnify:CR=1 FL=1